MFRYSPWFVDESVAFLNELLSWYPKSLDSTINPQVVIEFGGGSSTMWLLSKGFKVISIEDSIDYADLLVKQCELFNKKNCFVDQTKNLEYVDLQEYDCLVILAKQWTPNLVKLFNIVKPFMLIDDGQYRLEVAEMWETNAHLDCILLLDNSEYCADCGLLPISAGYPERAKAYRKQLRSSENKSISFEASIHHSGNTTDYSGQLVNHRQITSIIYKSNSLLSRCIPTNRGTPHVTPENSDDNDLLTLRDRVPYPSDQSIFLAFNMP